MMKDKKQTCKDVYDRYHKFPGDTSEGRVLTVLFSIIGAIISLIGVISMNFNFFKFDTYKYTANEYLLDGDFKDISLKLIEQRVQILKSTDGKAKIVSFEREKMQISYSISGDLLSIKQENHRKWYDYIGISTKKQTLTLYLPDDIYSSLTISNVTGDIDVDSDFTFDSATVKTTTGDINFKAKVNKDLKITLTTGDIDIAGEFLCENINVVLTTGDINLSNIKALNSINLKSTTGDISFTNCDALSTTIKTTTGDIIGSFSTPKVITAKTTTGKISIPSISLGDNCKLSTTTGNIKITFLN